jgi:hypothetical protein
MQRKLGLLALIGLLVLNAGPILAEEGFYVVGMGGIRVGTKITRLPYTISASGSYYLGTDLSAATGQA